MGKAYSEDLRLKVLAALDGGLKKSVAHRLFGISRSTIDDWLLQREAVGHVRPYPRVSGSGRSALGDGEVFEAFALGHQGATLEQMSVSWEQQTGRKLARNTFSLALRKLGWTRKKRVVSTESATKKSVCGITSNSATSRPKTAST